MKKVEKKEFKNDPIFSKLLRELKADHKVPEHTIKVLLKNRHIKDFCEESRHFVILSGKGSLYLHYDVANWMIKDGIAVQVESIAMYDNFIEFEGARMRQLHGAKNKNIPNIN